MPPLYIDDFHKLQQKIAVLETKITGWRLLWKWMDYVGMTQNSGQDHAYTRLISPNMITKKPEDFEL